MKTITILDQYNKYKSIQVKKSNCSHFYQRQLINEKSITNWQRVSKDNFMFTIKAYSNSAALSQITKLLNL